MLFGLFPISGLFSKDPQNISFKWISLHTLFSACFMVASLSYTLLMLIFQLRSGSLTASNIVGVIFFGNCSIISIFFFKLAMSFGKIIQRWSEVEKNLQISNSQEGVVSTKWSLRKRVNVCLTVSLCLAAMEHSLSLSTAYQRGIYEKIACNWTVTDDFEFFVAEHLRFVFTFLEYGHPKAIVAEFFNISFTFYWNFLDIFLMMISIGLSYNYEQINNRLNFFKERILQDDVWFKIRKDYNEVSSLVKFLDSHLEKMIVLACFNDSYFIIVQLLNISS